MGDSSLLKGALVVLCAVLVIVLFMPKECAKNAIPAGALRPRSEAPKGLRIESTTPAPKPHGEVTYPVGLDAQRLQYLVEINTAFAAPRNATLPKGGRFDATPVVTALKSLGYLTTQPDGSYALTNEGLLNANAADEGSAWSIPIAKREYLRADVIDCTAPDLCTATFTWQWKPTAVGAAMQPQIFPHEGTARLAGGANQWVVSEVRGIDAGW
jgi:hypothetical protein